MQYSDSPILGLITDRISEAVITRRDLGNLLSRDSNRAKSFNRLDAFLRGEELNASFIEKLANRLGIDAEDIAEGWSRHRAWEDQSHRERVMAYRGRHLWVFPKRVGSRPSFVTMIGADIYFLVRLPEWLANLGEDEDVNSVCRFIREEAPIPRLEYVKGRIERFQYRRNVDEAFDISPEGEFIKKVEDWSDHIRAVTVKVGGMNKVPKGLLREGKSR